MNPLPCREAKSNRSLRALIFLDGPHNGSGQDGGDFVDPFSGR
jgi:hypothetical protein